MTAKTYDEKQKAIPTRMHALIFLMPLLVTLILQVPDVYRPLMRLGHTITTTGVNALMLAAMFLPSYVLIAALPLTRGERLRKALVFSIIVIPYAISMWLVSFAIQCSMGNCL